MLIWLLSIKKSWLGNLLLTLALKIVSWKTIWSN